MADFLGGLFGILLGLIIVALIGAVPLVILAHYALKGRRMWRRWQAEQRPRQPYDDAFERELWDIGAANGRRDARRRALGPQDDSGSP